MTEPQELDTPYGKASFTLTLANNRVIQVTPPLYGLPDTVYKLTYGKEWEAARDYFDRLAATLPYRYAAEHTDVAYPELYAHDEEVRNRGLKKAMKAERELQAGRNPDLLPYFISLLPIESHRNTWLVHRLIGRLGTEAARNFLLGELESEGYHPFTTSLLTGLTAFADNDTRRRLEGVYAEEKILGKDLRFYLGILPGFGPAAHNHVVDILHDHAQHVDAIVSCLTELGLPGEEVAERVRARFDREADYDKLDGLLGALIDLDVPAFRLNLAAVNAKMDAPEYTDLPPVNWPQQLETAWRELVAATPPDEALPVLADYLTRPEPRLQRNAVLQLRELYRLNPDLRTLPTDIERRLRELLASRIDKVYVEVLNLLGRHPLELSERRTMLDAVLAVALRSRYRMVVLRALRRVGRSAEDRAYVEAFVEQARRAADEERTTEIESALPYLAKYLRPPKSSYSPPTR